jgi:hypothetical protein
LIVQRMPNSGRLPDRIFMHHLAYFDRGLLAAVMADSTA